MDKWVVKYDINIFIVSYDVVNEYEDYHLFVSKTDRTVLEEPFPTDDDSYDIVKVLWYYEPGESILRLKKDVETELAALLCEELAGQINQQILNELLLLRGIEPGINLVD